MFKMCSGKLRAGEIHVWLAYDQKITDPSAVENCYGVMSGDEKETQRKFFFEKHRHQYLITRALVRFALSTYRSDVAPHEWLFENNAYGRPQISRTMCRGDLYFNVSHTNGMIALAVASVYGVGIDVENTARTGKYWEIANHYFSPEEVAGLNALPVACQAEHFFDLWTLKESYIKACGKGLSIPLESFSFSLNKRDAVSISFDNAVDDKPDHWHFWQRNPTSIHKIALAFKKAPDRGVAPSVTWFDATDEHSDSIAMRA